MFIIDLVSQVETSPQDEHLLRVQAFCTVCATQTAYQDTVFTAPKERMFVLDQYGLYQL